MTGLWQPYTVEGVGELYTVDPVLAGILVGALGWQVGVTADGLRLLHAPCDPYWYRPDHPDAEMIEHPFGAS